MATYLWSTLVDGSTTAFNVAVDILSFDDPSISASNRGMITWTGTDVIFSVGGKANAALNKTVHFTITGGGRALTDANVTYADGSKLLIGDNTQNIGNGSSTFDDAANSLTGTAFNDRFIGLGGNDTLNGGAGNDTFSLGNGGSAFGNDSVDGGTGLGDAIGVGTYALILHGSTVNFSTHMLTSVDGTATFSNIENAFGTNFADTFLAFDPSRVLTGLGASNRNFDFTRTLEGNAGNDTFQGDSRDGYFELVNYEVSPSGVVVNLATGLATDGYDSDLGTGGIQPYTDTLVNIDGVRGSAFNDLLIGGGPATTISGVHFENFEGMAGNDTIDANGSANDRVDYLNSPGGVTVNLATGTASDGWGGSDTLIGISGVRGSNFNDTITGDANNNFLDGRNGNDFIDGGAGVDRIWYSAATSAVTIDLALGSSSLTGGQGTDTWVNIEGVRGGDFNDTLRGADGVDNVLEGQAGADLLDGRSGTDLVRYDRSLNAVNVNLSTNLALDGYDSDLVTGGIQPYTDTLVSIERVRGSKFNDTLTGNSGDNGFEGWAGNDTIDGGTDAPGDGDTAEYRNSPGAVIVNLATGTASDGWGGTDTLISIENAEGSDFADSIVGSAVANELRGGDGNDSLVGGDGDDTLIGGAGNDTLDGGAGIDTAVFSGDLVAYSITKTSTGYTVKDNVEADGTDSLSNIERLQFSDINIALDFDNAILGTGNDDVLVGGQDKDFVFGGAGNDNLIGNDGDDTLDGGAGADVLNGGDGNDVYYVDDQNDQVVETSNSPPLLTAGLPPTLELAGVLDGFIDTVIAAISYSLSPENLQYVENVTLAGAARTVTGNELDNELTGNELINTLTGGAGNDTLDGGAGADTAVFSGESAAYTINGAAPQFTVSGPEGNDTLSNIERLQFSDKSLAFDMTVSEAGGKTALLLGACLGKDGLNDKAIVGVILSYFDGGYTLTDAATALVYAGIVAQLAGGADNQHFVDWMALNLVEALPDAATEAVLIEFITSGQFTQATFLATLAAHQINQDHIGLVGLQDNGMEYL